ncbi:Transposon Ty3-I Gag-Pol polyprotein, partial [Trichinella sp. T8]
MNRASDGATNGERGRMSENPRWIMPPEALTLSSDVERWFIRMERYFRAADVPHNRRAAMVQYHMDEAMGDVLSALEVEETDDYDKLKSTLFRDNSEERYMKEFINRRQRENESVEEYAGHLKRLLPKAFPQLKEQADDILLQQFKAGIPREELMINQVTAATASASVVTSAADVKKETSGHEGETGSAAAIHSEQPSDIDKLAMKVKELLAGEITATTRTKALSHRDCHSHTGSQHGRDEPQSRVSNTNHNIPIIVVQSPITDIPLVEGSVGGLKCKMLVDTGAAVTLAAEEVMKGSKVLRRVPKPSIRLEAASGAELAVTNAYVMEIVLGGTVRVQHTVLWVKGLSHQFLLGWDFMRSHGCTPDPVANCLRIRQSSIPFTKPIAVAPVGTKSANSRSQILVAMEQMLPKEQEAGGKYRPTLSAILEQFSDVLATSDEDLGRTSVIRHAIHTGDAKPVRCSPRRIAYHQRAQVETLLNEMIHRDVIEPSCSPWASPIVLVNKKDGTCRFCVDYRQLNN